MRNVNHSLRYIVNRYDSNGCLSILHRASLHSVTMQGTTSRTYVLSEDVERDASSKSENTSAMKNRTTGRGHVVSKEKETCPHCMGEISIGNMGKHINGHMRRSGYSRKYCQWCAFQTTMEDQFKLHIEETHGRCSFCNRKPPSNLNGLLHYHKLTCPKRS